MAKEIILASESLNRQELLRTLGLPFRAIPSRIDEDVIIGADPIERVKNIAKAKAYAVAEATKGLIIAADTFAIYNGREYQKPKDNDDARKMLKELSGQHGQSVTGICIYDTETGEEVLDHRVINMYCNELSDEEIEKYVEAKPVTQWAATYNPLDELSTKIFVPVGDYTYRIEYYGLPIDVVSEAVKKIGFAVDLSMFESKS